MLIPLPPPNGPDGGGLPSSAEQPLTFKCNKTDCTFEADTSQKLAIHMFKIHQVKSIWKNYIILRWLQVKVVGCEVVGCKFAEVMHHITKGNAGYIPQNKICSRKFSQGSSIGRTSSKSTWASSGFNTSSFWWCLSRFTPTSQSKPKPSNALYTLWAGQA